MLQVKAVIGGKLGMQALAEVVHGVELRVQLRLCSFWRIKLVQQVFDRLELDGRWCQDSVRVSFYENRLHEVWLLWCQRGLAGLLLQDHV